MEQKHPRPIGLRALSLVAYRPRTSPSDNFKKAGSLSFSKTKEAARLDCRSGMKLRLLVEEGEAEGG
jgi:hypothetical protein